MAARNASEPANNLFEFRIGIQGDIVVEDDDIFGDGVNIAARLEGLAEPGDICLSARVQEDATGKLDLVFEDIGEQQLKQHCPAGTGLPYCVERVVSSHCRARSADAAQTSPQLQCCRSPI